MVFQKLGGREQLAAAECIPILWINFFAQLERAVLVGTMQSTPGSRGPWHPRGTGTTVQDSGVSKGSAAGG